LQAAKKKQAAPEKAAPAPQAKAAPRDEPKAEPTPEPASAAPGKKKVNAALAAIQRQQAEMKRRQEEKERAVAEERARIEEEELREEEDAKRKEELRTAKKLREKEKIEQQKREGTFRTKAQREADAKAQLRLKQLVDSGTVKVGGLDGAEHESSKKAVIDRRKKKKAEEEARKEAEVEAARKQLEELRLAEEAKKKEEEERARAEAEAKAAEESDGPEDWEAEADAMDNIKESWDQPSEDEAPKKKSANGNTAASKKPPHSKQTADSDESDSEDDSSSEEEGTAAQRAAAARKAVAAERRKKHHEEALAARSTDDLRSPICCILGHVDTGKTKLLDKIRQTNVQEGEAGGITQQIGATYFPVDALRKKTQVVNQDGAFEFKVPGLLVIDTPGHESFSNLRSRGSSLCNIAILVVDIMHGLEPQTLESMRLLRDRKTPFVVALNKIDRLFGWKKIDNNGFRESLAKQNKSCQDEFRDRLNQTKLAFAEQGFNSELYYENKSMARFVSLVPTSAHTGEGIPDILKLLVQLTQERMANSLMYLSEVEATVLEVKVIEGLGTTIDVILSNGVLQRGDRIVLCGTNGPISTNIRALLTPAEMKELRVKSEYVPNKEVKAAMGVKIAADGLDHAVAGSRLLVVGEDDDEEDLEEEVMSDLENLLSRVAKSRRGVSVQASTLGSLEALLEFLRASKIPVGYVNIGPVFKRDVIQTATMLEKAKEYAVMLCFDVKVDKDAAQYAADLGIKVFTADIIYHLFDAFTKHIEERNEQKKEENKLLAVFPCVLKPVAVFNKHDPIVVGVDVVEGSLKLLTPIAAVKVGANGQREVIELGRV
jgi:translation initiation factor 5B